MAGGGNRRPWHNKRINRRRQLPACVLREVVLRTILTPLRPY